MSRIYPSRSSFGGGGSGSGLSEIPILLPGATPTRADWVAGAYQDTGESLSPIRRQLAGGHGSTGRFAPIGNNGYELLVLAASYAAMQSPPDEDHTFFWQWEAGQNVIVGDLAQRTLSGTVTYHICITAHLTVAGGVANGPPNVAAQVNWEVYDRAVVGNRGSYLGLFNDDADVPNSILSSGKWAAFHPGYLVLQRYTVNPNRWITYSPTHHSETHGTEFHDNAEALRDVQSFVEGEDQYFFIAGQVRILRSWSAPTAGHEVFQAEVLAGPKAQVQFWGEGQTSADPFDVIDHTRTGTSAYHRHHFHGTVPDLVLYGHDFGVRALNAADATETDLLAGETLEDLSVLEFPPGSYRMAMSSTVQETYDTTLGLFIYKVMTGDDDYLYMRPSTYGTNHDFPLHNEDAQRRTQAVYINEVFKFTEVTRLTFISGTFAGNDGPNGTFALDIEKLD